MFKIIETLQAHASSTYILLLDCFHRWWLIVSSSWRLHCLGYAFLSFARPNFEPSARTTHNTRISSLIINAPTSRSLLTLTNYFLAWHHHYLVMREPCNLRRLVKATMSEIWVTSYPLIRWRCLMRHDFSYRYHNFLLMKCIWSFLFAVYLLGFLSA